MKDDQKNEMQMTPVAAAVVAEIDVDRARRRDEGW
jgi:hypothetical protein